MPVSNGHRGRGRRQLERVGGRGRLLPGSGLGRLAVVGELAELCFIVPGILADVKAERYSYDEP